MVGCKADLHFVDEVFEKLSVNLTRGEKPAGVISLPVARNVVRSKSAGPSARSGRKQAVVFGMGQYAKTAVVPRVGEFMDIRCWHEVDPTQVGPIGNRTFDVRTSMYAEPNEHYDVYFAAGFHHTHAPIGIWALEHGADVVVEKPLATTSRQLDALLTAMAKSTGRLFAGFHKRYSPFNELLRSDLQISAGTAVSYRATVFEVPLPIHHWYLWPNSRGRIVCNGCHWIDHFLFLNNFCRPTQIESRRLGNGDVVVLIDLENGASFSLIITEHGSSRLGVREHLNITAGNRTAVIQDERRYWAETSAALLRKKKANRYAAAEQMYQSIMERIVSGAPGDSVESVEISTRAMLDAQDQLQ